MVRGSAGSLKPCAYQNECIEICTLLAGEGARPVGQPFHHAACLCTRANFSISNLVCRSMGERPHARRTLPRMREAPRSVIVVESVQQRNPVSRSNERKRPAALSFFVNSHYGDVRNVFHATGTNQLCGHS